jgi:hypothetical protein
MRVIPRYRPNPKRDPLKVLAAMERVSWCVLSQCFRPDCCQDAVKAKPGLYVVYSGRSVQTATARSNRSQPAFVCAVDPSSRSCHV